MDFVPSSSGEPSMADFPLLSLEADPADFDYGAFLQEDDAEYFAEDSSNSASTNVFTDNSIQTITPQQRVTSLLPNSSFLGPLSSSPPKPRLERRGHTKSRRGCFNCKRRRIKCQETRPACGHCTKTGLKCEYPTIPQVVHQPSNQIPLFSLQDMRFFQHFLLHCYPHVPLKNESIWTHEVPCLSQNHEYLMHAILGLAASELMQEDPSLAPAAMAHRVKAIKAIKTTLAAAPTRATGTFDEEGNALMAACFALTFQSVIMDDGMAEYMTFIRGVVIVAIQMYVKRARLIFSNLGEDQMKILQPLIAKLPPIDSTWTDAAVQAIQALAPLCQGALERTYHQMLLDIAVNLYVSPVEAYKGISKHYGWWMQLPHDDFQKVVDPGDQVFTLLATHWIALKMIMATITEAEQRVAQEQRRAAGQPEHVRERGIDIGITRWLRHLNRRVDAEHRGYNRWPAWVEAQLDRDVAYFGRGSGRTGEWPAGGQ